MSAAAATGPGAGQSRELGTQPGSQSMWMPGAQLLESSLLPPGVCVRKKLVSGAEGEVANPGTAIWRVGILTDDVTARSDVCYS